MELYYEGTNIADRVSITKCIHREFSGGRSDCLEIEFEDAAAWHRWQPKENDQIIAAMNGYDTGILYLNTIIPEDGRFRILATSLPGIGHRKANKSFEGMTLGAIMAACAAECGMTSRLYRQADEMGRRCFQGCIRPLYGHWDRICPKPEGYAEHRDQRRPAGHEIPAARQHEAGGNYDQHPVC